MYVLQCLLLECNLQKGAKHRDARPACADWHFFLLLHNNRSSWLLWCITNNKPINTWDRKWYFGSRLFGLRTDFRGSQCRYTDPNHRSTIYHSVILILWKRYAIHLCKNSLTFFSENNCSFFWKSRLISWFPCGLPGDRYIMEPYTKYNLRTGQTGFPDQGDALKVQENANSVAMPTPPFSSKFLNPWLRGANMMGSRDGNTSQECPRKWTYGGPY